jgi:hypothetical protein
MIVGKAHKIPFDKLLIVSLKLEFAIVPEIRPPIRNIAIKKTIV